MAFLIRDRLRRVAAFCRAAWWNTTEPFRLDRTPAWITLGIFAVSLPLLVWRLLHGFTADDFGTVVLTATLIAILWTAHYTFRGVRHARQAREQDAVAQRLARISMAVAAMAELDWLEPSLVVLETRIDTRRVKFLERPQLRHALENIGMFSSSAASRLSEFDAVLRQIEAQCALYGADHEAAEYDALTHGIGVTGVPTLNRNPKWVQDIRQLITAARTMIPILKTVLLAES